MLGKDWTTASVSSDSTQLLPPQKQRLEQLEGSGKGGPSSLSCHSQFAHSSWLLFSFYYSLFLISPSLFNFNTLPGYLQCTLIESLLNLHLLPSASALPSLVLLEEAPWCPRGSDVRTA